MPWFKELFIRSVKGLLNRFLHFFNKLLLILSSPDEFELFSSDIASNTSASVAGI